MLDLQWFANCRGREKAKGLGKREGICFQTRLKLRWRADDPEQWWSPISYGQGTSNLSGIIARSNWGSSKERGPERSHNNSVLVTGKALTDFTGAQSSPRFARYAEAQQRGSVSDWYFKLAHGKQSWDSWDRLRNGFRDSLNIRGTTTIPVGHSLM